MSIIILQGFEVQEQCSSNIIENVKFLMASKSKEQLGGKGGPQTVNLLQ